MFSKIALVTSWFLFAPLAIILSLIFLHQDVRIISLSGKIATGTYPQTIGSHIEGQVLGVQISDTRPYIVANLLEGRQLEPYAQYMVETSDKYAIDYRLIPAIAMKESGGGDKAPPGTYNAWGFENGATVFNSWEQAIDIVGKTLKERYIAKGLTTPEEIMAVYAPPQLLTGGKWAKDIHYFFSQMESL
ncbi:glucosaminidase domain-containing protein [Candidatus Curtissbacteria bacterium]|nr:glucosaminidase domain-containing protein [Candidatus Curtissbacteria bacterium]